MPDDPNPTLSGQLTAARGVLAPQIRGLADLAATSVSPELRAKLQEVQASRQRRDRLLAIALAARDAYVIALSNLETDGYPDLPEVTLPLSLLSEIKEENADLAAATKVFADGTATTGRIEFSAPMPKPQ
jgi:hypothetical protein